jgi:hypothetical protein
MSQNDFPFLFPLFAISLFELADGHSEVFGEPFDVRLRERNPGIRTAISRALGTVIEDFEWLPHAFFYCSPF